MPMSEDTGRKCRPCEIGWGAIGLVAGSLILLIAVDLISDGKITRLATGQRRVAPVIPLKKDRHDDAG